MVVPVRKHAWLVLLVTVGIEGQCPSVLIAEVAQPHQMDRAVSQTLDGLLPGFRPTCGGKTISEMWFLECIYVAKCSAEPNLNASEFPCITFFRVSQNPLARTCLNRVQYLFPPNMRRINPWAHGLLLYSCSSLPGKDLLDVFSVRENRRS
jgi:hypothetical protein